MRALVKQKGLKLKHIIIQERQSTDMKNYLIWYLGIFLMVACSNSQKKHNATDNSDKSVLYDSFINFLKADPDLLDKEFPLLKMNHTYTQIFQIDNKTLCFDTTINKIEHIEFKHDSVFFDKFSLGDYWSYDGQSNFYFIKKYPASIELWSFNLSTNITTLMTKVLKNVTSYGLAGGTFYYSYGTKLYCKVKDRDSLICNFNDEINFILSFPGRKRILIQTVGEDNSDFHLYNCDFKSMNLREITKEFNDKGINYPLTAVYFSNDYRYAYLPRLKAFSNENYDSSGNDFCIDTNLTTKGEVLGRGYYSDISEGIFYKNGKKVGDVMRVLT